MGYQARNSRNTLSLLLAVLLVALTCPGCGGSGSNSVLLAESGLADDQTTGPVAGSQPQAPGLVGLPQDAWVDPDVILARRGSELTQREQPGSNYYAKSDNAVIGSGVAALYPDNAEAGSWVVYDFDNLVDADYPIQLSVEFQGENTLPESCYLGISDYDRGAWDWQVFAEPALELSAYLPGHFSAVSPGGNLYVVVMALGSDLASVASVALELETSDPPPPVWTALGEGTDPDLIQFSWEDPEQTYPGLEYTGVRIERAMARTGPWVEVTTQPKGPLFYIDTAASEPGQPVYYRLRTVRDDTAGWAGPVGRCWLTVGDVEYLSASDNDWYWIDLNWPPVEWAEGYRIEYMATNGSDPAEWGLLAVVEGGGNTAFAHSPDSPAGRGAVVNSNYSYRVRAVIGESLSANWSPVDTGVFKSVTKMNLYAVGNPLSVKLSWGKFGASGYLLEYMAGTGEPAGWVELAELEPGATSLEHSESNPPGKGCADGVTYSYRIKPITQGRVNPDWDIAYARREVGSVSWSATILLRRSEELVLWWNPLLNVEGYVIEYKDSDGAEPADWTELNSASEDAYEREGYNSQEFLAFHHRWDEPPGRQAAPGITYSYRIKAYFGSEYSAEWGAFNGAMRIPVEDFTEFSASDIHADRVAFTVGTSAYSTGLVIEYRNLDGGDPVDWTLLQADTADHTATSPTGRECAVDTNYEYRIKGTAGDALSPNWLTDAGRRGLVDVIDFTATDGWYSEEVTLEWDKVYGIDGYRIEYRDSGGVSPTDWTLLTQPAGTADSFSHTTLVPVGKEAQPDVYYEYRIKGRVGAELSSGWAFDPGHCGGPVDTWPMQGENAQRTFRTHWTGPAVPEVKWSVPVRAYSPVVNHGHEVVVSAPTGLKVYDVSGSLLRDFSSGIGKLALQDSGTIIARSEDLTAYHPDGTLRWRLELSSYAELMIGADSTIFTSAGGLLLAITDFGMVHWSHDTGEAYVSSIAQGPGGDIYTCAGTDLLALDQTGELLWTYPSGDEDCHEPAVADDGTIHFLSRTWPQMTLHAVNPDGTRAWDTAVSAVSWDPKSLAIAGDGTVYMAMGDQLQSIAADGTANWNYPIDNLAAGYVAIDGAGTVYTCSEECDVWAVNPDGTLRWSISLSDWSRYEMYPLILGGDGVVMATTFDENQQLSLFAIGEAD